MFGHQEVIQNMGVSETVVSEKIMNADERLIMQTARVQLTNLNNENVIRDVQVLLDCGSQRTYLTKFAAEKLKLKEVGKSHLVVYTFGSSKPDNIETPVVEIGFVLKSGFIMRLRANVVPEISGKIQRAPINDRVHKSLSNFELGDTVPMTTEKS